MSTDDFAAQIDALPAAEMATIAEHALGDSIRGAVRWRAEPMSVLSTGTGSLGFFRVLGVDGDERRWTAVLKILDPGGQNKDWIAFEHATKELAALGASELRSVETGMRPAPVFDLQERPDGTSWLWMKDLSAAPSPPWDAETYVRSIRHVGQFNGLWIEVARPDGDWITDDPNHSRAASLSRERPIFYELLAEHSDHPYVRLMCSVYDLERVLRLVDDVASLVNACHSLKRSVAHHDCHARNLFPWTGDVTYAIDWASIGMAPIGFDGGSVAGGGFWWGQEEAETIAANEGAIFDSYVAGLRDSGWDGDPADVKLAYLTQVAGYVMSLPFVTGSCAADHPRKSMLLSRWGTDEQAAVRQVADRLERFIPMVDEALEMASQR